MMNNLLLTQNRTAPLSFIQIVPILPKLDIWGCWGVGRVVGELNITPVIVQTYLLLLDIIETFPPSFIQIEPKLTKFVIWGGFRVIRVAKLTPSHTICYNTISYTELHLPTKLYPNRTQIEAKFPKLFIWGGFWMGAVGLTWA